MAPRPVPPGRILPAIGDRRSFLKRSLALAGGGATTPAAAAADQVRPLAEKSGCLACHGARQRLVGPSLAEIASRYRTDSGAEPRLAAKLRSGGQGAWGNVPMPPQPQLPENDARTLIRWILTSD